MQRRTPAPPRCNTDLLARHPPGLDPLPLAPADLPRIGPHREAIRQRVATLLGIDPACVNLKATTTEQLGFIGRAEGMGALATVLIGQG